MVFLFILFLFFFLFLPPKRRLSSIFLFLVSIPAFVSADFGHRELSVFRVFERKSGGVFDRRRFHDRRRFFDRKSRKMRIRAIQRKRQFRNQ